MFCDSDEADNTAKAKTDAACDGKTVPCNPGSPECPTVEIEINNTPATNDDLVQVKCILPAQRYKIPCRIRATGGSVDGAFVLTNPDGRLRFPNDADTTKALTVPHDGSWVAFEISGETGSTALNDAVIEAHCNTATGALKGQKTVTVFWFDQAKIDITVGGNYTRLGGNYSVAGNAVNISAETNIKPAGVNCAAPQVQNLKVGILQNAFPPLQRNINWGNPTIRWRPGVVRGTSVSVPNIIRQTLNITATTNDSTSLSAPLYDQPGKVDTTGGNDSTLDANSLKPPKGCTGGATATSNDTPSQSFGLTLTFPASTATGVVGDVDYTFISYTQRDNFRTWAVIFNITDNTFCTLKERVWRTNLNSAAAGPQHATAEADSAPTVAPVTGAPFYNGEINNLANITRGPFGTANTLFTKT